MAKRQKETESQEPPSSLWVRYNQQPGMPCGPHTFGPFATSLKPAAKVTLNPGEWTEVNGEWGVALQASALSQMFSFSLTKP